MIVALYSISEIPTSPIAMVGTGELSTSKFKYETQYISKDFIIFSECQAPCKNLNPRFKTFWRRFCFLNFTYFHVTV